MAWKFWMLSAAVFCSALAACGDDDVTPAPTDLGTAPDLYVPPTDLGQPTDGGITDAGHPTGDCDPYAAGSCPADQKCAVVIRNSGLPNVTITFECVPNAGRRLEGQVCNFENLPGGTRVDGGIVDYYDLCEQGTFCWDTQDIPGYPPRPRTCQKICGADGVYCQDTEYCQLLNSDDPATAVVEPTFGTCTPSQGCDPVFQTGCSNAADACYLVYSTRSEMLGACLETNRDADAGTPFAPGTACDYATQCAPGAGCLPTVVDGGFGDGTRACREYCSVSGVIVDAGTPPADGGSADAGVVRSGHCAGALGCAAFPIGDPDAGMPIRVPTVPGICQ